MTIELLKAGIDWWGNKPRWDKDFLNSFYTRLYTTRPDKLNDEWWGTTVDDLSRWRATRPKSNAEITQKGLDRLTQINTIYSAIRNRFKSEPTIVDLQWSDIAPLFDIMNEIKNGQSPVLPSKLGHLLLPRVFVVIDNEATGVYPYQFLWRMMKNEWDKCEDKDAQIQTLSAAILQQAAKITSDYPFETKIPELWLIGYKSR